MKIIISAALRGATPKRAGNFLLIRGCADPVKEAADLLFHLLVLLKSRNLQFSDVIQVLQDRAVHQ